MRKVFISYHHDNDQYYKDTLDTWGKNNGVFMSKSVDAYEIPDEWDDQQIRKYIRDNKLRDSSVTILLVGTETKYRKHVDWEIYSSMYDGQVSKQSGIIVITLPSIGSEYQARTGSDPVRCENLNWGPIETKTYFNTSESHLPDRIVDNLVNPNGVMVSVLPWNVIESDPQVLINLIESAGANRALKKYDLSRKMRRSNYNL